MKETKYIVELKYQDQELEVWGTLTTNGESKFLISSATLLGKKTKAEVDLDELSSYILKTKFKK